MVKRGLFVIIVVSLIVLNFITFVPLALVGLLWISIIETSSWIIRGNTIIKDPLFTMVEVCLWSGNVLYYIERNIKLNI